MVENGLKTSITGRAIESGAISVEAVDIRDYTTDKHRHVDDAPYGGGAGMVIQPAPVCDAYEALCKKLGKRPRVIYMTPQGRVFNQSIAQDLAKEEDLVFLCGHYEGIDERALELIQAEYLSAGDFVLTGGELPSMVMIDCISRLVPGVLNNDVSAEIESFHDNLLEYPQYTRPETWEGRTVPEVLRGGNHAEIEAWRTRQSLERTLTKRPDLFQQTPPTPDEQRLLDKIRRDRSRPQLVEPPVCRIATEDDLPAILAIVQQARNYLRRHRVDQWQGTYPNEDTFRADIAAGTCHVLTYQGAVAAVFTLTFAPEPAYDALTDGRWRSDREHAAVLHRNAVSAEWRGTGLSDLLMQEVERLARESGAHAVRVDTHRHNGAQKKLLERHGYRFCGNILCDEPGHDPRRQAFEKLLK